METKLLNVDDVCDELGITTATLANWYKFKTENPEAEICNLLPEIIRIGPRNARFWRVEDLDRLKTFRDEMPRGRRGIMGSVTQRYIRKGEA